MDWLREEGEDGVKDDTECLGEKDVHWDVRDKGGQPQGEMPIDVQGRDGIFS